MPDGARVSAPGPVGLEHVPAVAAAPAAELALERGGALAEPAPDRAGMGVLFWVCAGWMALTILLALLAPLLPLPKPTAQDYSVVNTGPSIHHLLGTDDLGRDMLSRIIWGSRVSLWIGFVSIAIAVTAGGLLALWAGYRRGVVDSGLSALSFVVLAFPPLLFILVVEAFWKPISLLKLTVLFAVVAGPQLFRIIRASTLSVASREFVVAARTMGATTPRILAREILPNVLPSALSFALIGVALAIITEGALAFLGLSVALPTPSLGNIINEAAQQYNLKANPLAVVWPSAYIFFMSVALNLMGDRIRARADRREGNL